MEKKVERLKQKFLKALHSAKEGMKIPRTKKLLLKLYLASPPKVQFALAKYGVKHAVKKATNGIKEEVLRH